MPRRVPVALMCVFLPVLYALVGACGILVIWDNRSALSFVLAISLAISFSTSLTHALSTQARKYCHVSIDSSSSLRLFARCFRFCAGVVVGAHFSSNNFRATASETKRCARSGPTRSMGHFCLRTFGLVLNSATWLTGLAWLEFWGLCPLVLLVRSVNS